MGGDQSFGLGGGGGFRVPSLGAGRKRRPPGAGPGRWVKAEPLGAARFLGGGPIRQGRARKRARRGVASTRLDRSLAEGAADKGGDEKEEAKAAAIRRRRFAARRGPAWWSPPSSGYCPESRASSLDARARSGRRLWAQSASAVKKLHREDLADLRDACAAAGASVADTSFKPESARGGIFKAGVEFALEAAARRSSTGMIGPPTTFLTGLAEDVGFAPGKAGRAVAAAVAARVRAELLQAGAQMRQGEDGAAMMTLDAVIGVLATFRLRNSPSLR